MAGKTRILIVDDDVSLCKSLSDILDKKGYETIAANSGEDVLRKIKKISLDVIIMDIKMPRMNGLEVFRQIKKFGCKTAVIMMTAFSKEDLIEDVLKEGAYGILYKPLDIDRVVRTIEAATGKGALITIVDDDPDMRETLRSILEDKGYVVTLAKDGEEAVRIVREGPEDIMFIDMKLPLVNGLGVYLAVRKINPKIVTVMITAYRQEVKDLVDQALEKGAYTCLYKPFNPEEAVNIVEEIVGKRKKKVDGQNLL